MLRRGSYRPGSFLVRRITMTDSVGTALAEGHVRETVRRHSFLFVLQGILMVIAGVVAFVYPLVTTLAVALFLGWVLIVSGVVQAITLLAGTRVPHFWLQLLSTVLWVITGLLFVRNPGVAVGTLALLMVIFFMVEGVAKIVLAMTVRPLRNWGLVLVSGLIGVALSLYLIANPALTLVVLGLFIGIQLISEGIAILLLAWNVRKA
jgi:uncharacterized membrane protein HdeD (DUF308 family)